MSVVSDRLSASAEVSEPKDVRRFDLLPVSGFDLDCGEITDQSVLMGDIPEYIRPIEALFFIQLTLLLDLISGFLICGYFELHDLWFGESLDS